jgi:hypothetical protein
VSQTSFVQDSCGCEYVLRDGDRLPIARCPLHGEDDPTRSFLATDGVSILPWDAMLYFQLLLERLERNIPEEPLDPALLDDVYDTIKSQCGVVGSHSNILAMLARSAILTVHGVKWQFVHRWTYDSTINDYVRR